MGVTRQHNDNKVPSQRLIDELLDGEVSRERSQELLGAIRRDAGASEELARTRIGIDRLREPIETPDLSEVILDRVHGRRRFLPGRSRRMVTAGRLAVAAGVVGAVGLASFVQRHAPQVNLGEQPATVSQLVEATEQTAPDRPMLAEQAAETIQASIASPIRALSLSPQIRPDADLHFDLSLDRPRVVAKVDYTMVRTPILLGVPEKYTYPSAKIESPFISRFGSLLVILREPQPTSDDQIISDADDSSEGSDQ